MISSDLNELLNLDINSGMKNDTTTKEEVMKMIKDLVSNSLGEKGRNIFVETNNNQFKKTPFKVREEFDNFCKSDNNMKPTLQIQMEEYKSEDRRLYHFFVLEDTSANKYNNKKSSKNRLKEISESEIDMNIEEEKTNNPFTLNDAEQTIMEALKECKRNDKSNRACKKSWI